MKKISIIAIACAIISGIASAQTTTHTKTKKHGGFIAGPENIATVTQIMEMRDDVPVVVQGNIVQRMGDEMYLFQDGTGTIIVEIEDDNWNGQTVTPEETVKLYGEVDRGLFKTELDINYIEKVQK